MSNIIKYEQQNLTHLKSLAKIASESKQYANLSESSLLNLMLSAHDLGISPMKAINGSFYVVNGKVCMSTALMADRIRKAGHSIKIVEMSKDKCVIVAVRKDNNDSLKFEYTWEDATLAGLVGSPTWKKFPKIMLYNRCMSSVARILFPDVVGNSYSEEERFDIENVPAEKRPLEDQDMITVDQPIEEPIKMIVSLTHEQQAALDVMLQEDPHALAIIQKTLKLEDVYQMGPKDFDRVIAFLNRRVEERENGQEAMA